MKGAEKYGISINPNKSLFVVKEGKVQGHIISMKGFVIGPKRVSAIQTLSFPRNKKEIQTFLRKINFLRRFIRNYAEIVKDITDMLKKKHEVKWEVSTVRVTLVIPPSEIKTLCAFQF